MECSIRSSYQSTQARDQDANFHWRKKQRMERAGRDKVVVVVLLTEKVRNTNTRNDLCVSHSKRARHLMSLSHFSSKYRVSLSNKPPRRPQVLRLTGVGHSLGSFAALPGPPYYISFTPVNAIFFDFFVFTFRHLTLSLLSCSK